MEILLFYVPFPSLEEAGKVIDCLLNEKLIACAQILNAESHYVWNGVICNEDEFPAIFKTDCQMAISVEKRVNDLHSYDVPAILHWKVSVNEPYGQWVSEQVNLKIK